MISRTLIALIALAASATAAPLVARDSGTPVASTAFALPTVFTPSQDDNPPASASPLAHGTFGIGSNTDFGMMQDYTNPNTLWRDGGGTCNIGNRTLWFFCDTLAYRKKDNRIMGAPSNSLSLAKSFDLPANLTDVTCRSSVNQCSNAIPLTSSEAAVSNSASTRYALWTFTNCVPTGDNTAVHFWQVNKFRSTSASSITGYTMAEYNIDPVSNQISITRNAQYAEIPPTYNYGAFANVVVNGVAYLYGLDVTYSGRNDLHLASAPVSTIGDMSTWSYYDASTKSWNSTAPVPTTRRNTAAVISNSQPFATGATVFFSEYHNAYLMVYFNNWADSTFRVLSAPTPTGPWTTNNKAVLKVPVGSGHSYGGVAHPDYYSVPGPTGQSLMLHYSYQGSRTYTRADKLTFA
ncbi:hypothetical protein V1512DRAFT_256532 [Lipomyces arxii]|uniref:uncharacterized protein n=1 Tax=Lipomyces arxii TaxID=56418 RepID=UPI0034CD209E